jgi:rfaE bifunctional protein kinase chain/domain
MNLDRIKEITAQYSRLRVALIGDFCLDRYLEIDPGREEVSIETGLPVQNVVNVRAQPGGAGTVLNNLVALGVAEIIPIGFCGEDGEGYELRRALASLPGVNLEHFVSTTERRTFTYCKPLVLEAKSRVPRELSRLDTKNWTPTPVQISRRISGSLAKVGGDVDAVIVLEQVDQPETGVLTRRVLEQVRAISSEITVIADGRRGPVDYPPAIFKMNAHELARMAGTAEVLGITAVMTIAAEVAARNERPVFVTLAERGIVGAAPSMAPEHVPALPLRGEIDIVGAGDAVTANLAAALASGASIRESMALAMLASSRVIHQLGTTGTATVADLFALHGRG